MRSNVTSTASIKQNELRKGRQGDGDDRSRSLHTGARQWRAGSKRRRQVDARSRPRTAPFAEEGLAGADRPGAAARVGPLRRRSESRYGWNRREAHDSGSADAARDRNDSNASRGSDAARVQLGWLGYAMGTR